MKKSNFWKLLSGTVFFATVALASCVDDNDDKGMPYLEVTPDVLTFNADGAPEGASAFTVKSNRPWTLEVLEGSDWVTPSATQGSGDGTVEFTIPASNVGRIAKLSFNLKTHHGAYWTKEVTIEQGEAPKAGEVSALVAYIKNTWPSLESGTEELNYSQKTIPAVILANNEGGNNFGKLYVGDNITLPNSAIILYSTTEFTRDNSAKYPVGKKVTLDLSAAQYAPYGNLREQKERRGDRLRRSRRRGGRADAFGRDAQRGQLSGAVCPGHEPHAAVVVRRRGVGDFRQARRALRCRRRRDCPELYGYGNRCRRFRRDHDRRQDGRPARYRRTEFQEHTGHPDHAFGRGRIRRFGGFA